MTVSGHYYPILNETGESLSFSGDISTYGTNSYARADSVVTLALTDYDILGFTYTYKGAEQPIQVTGTTFTMPDAPVTITVIDQPAEGRHNCGLEGVIYII